VLADAEVFALVGEGDLVRLVGEVVEDGEESLSRGGEGVGRGDAGADGGGVE